MIIEYMFWFVNRCDQWGGKFVESLGGQVYNDKLAEEKVQVAYKKHLLR
jgi:hypothetical protein